MAKPYRLMQRSYADSVKLFGTRGSRFALGLMLALWLLTPLIINDDFALTVLGYAGIAAIGAIGLNLLTGYTGQISLGHAFFIGCGAYAAASLGGQVGDEGLLRMIGLDLDTPIFVWLPAAFVIGAVIGALVGPFALRLRGNYLAIVTLGLVFIGEHLFRNLDGITGGNDGTNVLAPTDVILFDPNAPTPEVQLFGFEFIELTNKQAYFWLIWGLVLVVALMVKNIVRSRPGRALQAIRDRDLAAEVIGIRQSTNKVWAFAISSGLAAVAGALSGSFTGFAGPVDQFGLLLSIQYVAIIIIGGIGTIFGAVLGALFLGGVPAIIDRYSSEIPFLVQGGGGGGIISEAALNQVIFGALIVGFLVFEPRGLAALWLRVKAWSRSWPFSY